MQHDYFIALCLYTRKILTGFGGESANECICIFFTVAKANKETLGKGEIFRKWDI